MQGNTLAFYTLRLPPGTLFRAKALTKKLLKALEPQAAALMQTKGILLLDMLLHASTEE